MYSDPVHPRPNPIWDAVPTPRPTPYLWTGLGWTKFRGSVFCGLPPTHALCVVDPPNHAAARALGPAVPEEADLAACRAVRAGRRTTFAVLSSDPNPPCNLTARSNQMSDPNDPSRHRRDEETQHWEKEGK